MALDTTAVPSPQLRAALAVEVQAAHVHPQPITFVEADGRDVETSAVVPCSLLMVTAAGGMPQHLTMGVPVPGSAPTVGQPTTGGFVLALDQFFGLPPGAKLLWAVTEGVLSGPIAVP